MLTNVLFRFCRATSDLSWMALAGLFANIEVAKDFVSGALEFSDHESLSDAESEAPLPERPPEIDIRGLWKFDGGKVKIRVPVPLQGSFGSDADSNISELRLASPGAGSIDEDDEDEPGSSELPPQNIPGSPRRSRHPAAWRTWSQKQRTKRPNTPDVLWPTGGKPWVRAPGIKRRGTNKTLAPLGASSVKYKDEHVGFKSSNQGAAMLANLDARRNVETEQRERLLNQRLAVKHANGADEFYTIAAKAAASTPEIFPLRVVRKEQKEEKEKHRQAKARRQRIAETKLRRQKDYERIEHERLRKEAIANTLRLPNVGRHLVSWAIFARRLLQGKRAARLGEIQQEWRQVVDGTDQQWQSHVQIVRAEYNKKGKGDHPKSQQRWKLLKKAVDSGYDFEAEADGHGQQRQRPTTPMTPLPALRRAMASAEPEPEPEDTIFAVEEKAESREKLFTAYCATILHGGDRGAMGDGKPPPDAVRHSFAEECRRQNLAPLLSSLPAPYLFGDTEAGRVELGNKGIGTGMVRSLAKALVELPKSFKVQHLDLSKNGLGPDAIIAIAPVVQRFTSSLGVIDLSHNAIGIAGCAALATALMGNIRLDELRLASCRIDDKCAHKIMPAIGECYGLEVVDLSSNEIGVSGSVSVAEMIERTDHLETFNLSWNKLRPAGCRRVIRALKENQTLHRLGLAWNGAGDAVLQLEEVIASPESQLVEIDLSSNGIGERHAQVLAGLLKRSKQLKRVVMKDNPVGIRGGRALCKALLVLNAHGCTVDMKGCNLGITEEKLDLFDTANPNGKYTLNLQEPYDEMVAYELVELAFLEDGENWKDEQLDGKKYELEEPKHFTREDRLCDHFELPETGILSLSYHSTRRRPKLGDAATGSQIETFKTLMTDSMAAELALNVACSICYFMTSQAIELVSVIGSHAGDKIDAVIALLPRVIDAEKIPVLLNLLNDPDLLTLMGRVGQDLFHFNPKNPTGGYKLDLADEDDILVVQALMDFTRDEKLYQEEHNLIDSSQCGGTGAWRNTTLDGEPFVWTAEWKPPVNESGQPTGTLELDYSSTNRPSAKAEPVLNSMIDNLLTDMASAFNRVELIDKQGWKKEDHQPATVVSATPSYGRKILQGAKKRFRRLSVGAGAVLSALNDFEPGQAEGVEALDLTADGGADVKMEEAMSPKSVEIVPLLIQIDEAFRMGEHGDALVDLQKGLEAYPDDADLQRLERQASDIVALDLPSVSHSPATETHDRHVLVMCISRRIGAVESVALQVANEKARQEALERKANMQAEDKSVKKKVKGVVHILSVSKVEFSQLDDGMDRPVWHVPHRATYPVPSEAERKRVGTMLANQLLRRSTFMYFFTCAQINRIVKWFPHGHRVETVVTLFARCLDHEHFYTIQRNLTAEETVELKQRLGSLQLMNPYMPDGPYRLDLAYHDERKVALMLIWLAEGEPGENWEDELYEHPGQARRSPRLAQPHTKLHQSYHDLTFL